MRKDASDQQIMKYVAQKRMMRVLALACHACSAFCVRCRFSRYENR